MPRWRFKATALASAAVLASLVFTSLAHGGTFTDNDPSAGLRRYQEDFNGFATGSMPSCGAACGSWYMLGTLGSGVTDVYASPPAGMSGKVLRAASMTAPYAAQFSLSGFGMDACSGSQSLQFAANIPDLSAGSTVTTAEARIQSGAITGAAGPANSVGVRFTGVALSATVNVALFIRGNTGAEVNSGTLGTFTGGATVQVTIANGNCSPTGAFTISVSAISGGTPQTMTLPGGVAIVGDMDEFAVVDTSGTTATTMYVDNFDWQGSPIPPPTVASVSPNHGSSGGGTMVTITGTGFTATPTVKFDTTPAASVVFVSATTLTAAAPAHAPGVVGVTVTNPDGQSAVLASAYTYDASPTVTVTGLDPDRGPVAGGTVVNVTGSNFQAGFTAAFDGTPSVEGQNEFVNSGLVRVVSPPQAEGPATLQVCNPDAQCDSAAYTYFTPTPGGGDPGGGVPTFEPPRTISTVANSGRNPDVDAAGADFVAVCHTAGSGNAVLFETTSDNGGSFATSPTGIVGNGRNVCGAIDGDHFAVTTQLNSGNNAQFDARYTLDGGGTWATSTINAAVGGTGLGVKGLDGGSGLYVAASPYCGPGTCGGGGTFLRAWKSTTSGASWTEMTAINSALIFPGSGSWAQVSSVDVHVVSASEYWVFIDVPQAAGGSLQAMAVHTVDGGASWASETLQDVIEPLSSSTPGYGSGIRGAPDGDHVTFYAGTTLYSGFRASSTTWRFQAVDATTKGTAASLALCGTDLRAVYQPDTTEGVLALVSQGGAEAPAVEVLVAGSNDGTTQNPGIASTSDTLHMVYRDPATQHLSYIQGTNCSGPVESELTASATLSLSGIDRFDVDAVGAYGVVRYGDGFFLTTFNAGTMAENQDFDAIYCETEVGGAFIQKGVRGTNILYSQCGIGPGASDNVATLHLRGSDLGSPDKPAGCDGAFGDFCEIDLDDGVLASPEDDTIEIAQLDEFPIDFSRSFTLSRGGCGDVCGYHSAWAFSTNDGRIGVVSYTWNDQEFDESHVDFVTIDATAGQGLNHLDLCSTSWTGGGKNVVYGASVAGGITGFSVSYREEKSNPPAGLVVELVEPWTPGTRASGPRAIACGDDKVAVARSNGEVLLYDRDLPTSQPKIILPAGSPIVAHGTMAMDASGQVLVLRDTEFRVYDIGNATPVLLRSTDYFPPAGTFINTQATTTAFWVASTEEAVMFEIPDAFSFVGDPTADTDRDGYVNNLDGDLDGDGVPNAFDPDTDGDGLCNGAAGNQAAVTDKPAGTKGAPLGCVAGDDDNDADGIPNDRDGSPFGCVMGCAAASGATGNGPTGGATPAQDGDIDRAILLGFSLIGGAALVGWLITGGLRRNRFGEWQASGGNPVIIGVFATLGLMGSWFIDPFFVVVTIAVTVIGGLVFWLTMGRKASGG